MSKLIEKEGKFYKECRLVFFNTEESAKFKELSVTPHDKLELSNFKGRNTYNDRIELYILSEESIQSNDWYEEFYSPHRILQNTTKEILDSRFGNKVIASTDPSLGLPQPSDKFIQAYIDAYNKGEKIEKVLVEYSCDQIDIDSMSLEEMYQSTILKPKLKDNNIIIKKVKDSWTREEVIELINSFYDHSYGGISHGTKDKWIEKNI